MFVLKEFYGYSMFAFFHTLCCWACERHRFMFIHWKQKAFYELHLVDIKTYYIDLVAEQRNGTKKREKKRFIYLLLFSFIHSRSIFPFVLPIHFARMAHWERAVVIVVLLRRIRVDICMYVSFYFIVSKLM